MVNPLRLRFTQIKFIIHSNQKQRWEAISCDGSKRIAICMQMRGRLTTLMRWCSLMSLKSEFELDCWLDSVPWVPASTCHSLKTRFSGTNLLQVW